MLHFLFVIFHLMGGNAYAAKESSTILFMKVGMLQKVSCKGRLQVSAVGDEKKVQIEALPKSMGCAVILRPRRAGRTNLLLETSAQSILKPIHILPEGAIRTPAVREELVNEKGGI